MPEQKRPGAVDASINRALELGEVGLQVAAYIGDECIVDAWAGTTASNGETHVQRDTLFPVFSVSKAFVATAVHLQAERGLIDYDAPLSRWWPEYTGSGRESVTIRQVLTHRAGVPQMPNGVNPERLADWSWMVKELAAIEPAYPPGTHNTYLSMSFGWLLGEIVCRSDPLRRPFGQFIREELCAPLGMDDFWMGLPAEEEWRVAELSYPNAPPVPPEGSLVRQAVPPQVGLLPEIFNRADIHQATIPGVGGIGNAHSVARLFAMLAGRGKIGSTRLLSEERVMSFLEPRPEAEVDDETYGMPMPVGMGGYWIVAPGVSTTGPLRDSILCHTAAGFTIGWGDLNTGLGVAICHNRMFGAVPESPWAALGDAIMAHSAS